MMMQLHYSLPLSVGFFHSTREMSAGSAPKDKTRITNYTKMSAAPGRLAISNIRTHTTSVCIYRLFLCIHLCTYIAEKEKKERSFIDGSLRDRFKAKRQPTDLEITICDEYSFKFISRTAALFFFYFVYGGNKWTKGPTVNGNGIFFPSVVVVVVYSDWL